MRITLGKVCVLHFARILCYPDVHRCGVEAICAWLFPLSVELETVPSTTQLEGLSALDNFQLLAACSSH
jgi:hypothetical protein